MEQQTEKVIKRTAAELAIFSGLFVVSVLAFTFLAKKVLVENNETFDTRVYQYLSTRLSAPTKNFLNTLTFFGSMKFLLPAYLGLILYCVYKRKRHYAIDIAAIAISSTALLFILKNTLRRSRPTEEDIFKTIDVYSFPSGHALSSFIFSAVLIYTVWRTRLPLAAKWLLSTLLLCFSLLIGMSRVVLGYHYASDVLAGLCLGFGWVMLSLRLSKNVKFLNS